MAYVVFPPFGHLMFLLRRLVARGDATSSANCAQLFGFSPGPGAFIIALKRGSRAPARVFVFGAVYCLFTHRGIFLTGSTMVAAAIKAPRIKSKNLISVIFCEATAIYGIIIAIILASRIENGYPSDMQEIYNTGACQVRYYVLLLAAVGETRAPLCGSGAHAPALNVGVAGGRTKGKVARAAMGGWAVLPLWRAVMSCEAACVAWQGADGGDATHFWVCGPTGIRCRPHTTETTATTTTTAAA
jgi:F0F1-type ATP synthase membrane subunit c/vacuolar-type H+-ATPase subunit K